MCVCESDQWNSIRQFVKHWPRIDLYCRILNDLFAPRVCADRDLPLFCARSLCVYGVMDSGKKSKSMFSLPSPFPFMSTW